MKELIIIISSVLLGLAIYGLILGDEGSIKSGIKDFWQTEVEQRSMYP